MKLTTVTLTGADDSVSPDNLWLLSRKYPFVEWGILLSRNSTGMDRFPSKRWLDRLLACYGEQPYKMKLSAHLCGGFVKEILMGDKRFMDEIGDVWAIFRRVQINTHGQFHSHEFDFLMDALEYGFPREFIFQYDDVNKKILMDVAAAPERQIRYSTLFDLSHGAGVLPEEWPDPLPGIKCGYAGGMSPSNVEEQIKIIDHKTDNPEREIWIDMETHLRSKRTTQIGDFFDLDKCAAVLNITENYISE